MILSLQVEGLHEQFVGLHKFCLEHGLSTTGGCTVVALEVVEHSADEALLRVRVADFHEVPAPERKVGGAKEEEEDDTEECDPDLFSTTAGTILICNLW